MKKNAFQFSKMSLPTMFFLFVVCSMSILYIAEFLGLASNRAQLVAGADFNYELHDQFIRNTLEDVSDKVLKEQILDEKIQQIDERLLEGAIRQLEYENSKDEQEFVDI